jgi:hypothetical protein
MGSIPNTYIFDVVLCDDLYLERNLDIFTSKNIGERLHEECWIKNENVKYILSSTVYLISMLWCTF